MLNLTPAKKRNKEKRNVEQAKINNPKKSPVWKYLNSALSSDSGQLSHVLLRRISVVLKT